jgi:hypothetical protein
MTDAKMHRMRSTFRIDDDLLEELREQAHKERVPLTLLLNRVLRSGIQASRERSPRRAGHGEETVAMGVPRFDLNKALALAAALEDEETVRKLTLRK